MIIFVEEWTGEVPRAISQEEDGIGDDFLCVAYMIIHACPISPSKLPKSVFGIRRTCRIRNLHTKNQDKRRIIRPGQIITNQAADFLLDRDEAQTE